MADLETRQVNSLYKRINNEALDEDQKANRKAVEFAKKQVELFSPDKKQAKVLSKSDMLNLTRLVSRFTTVLNKYSVFFTKFQINNQDNDELDKVINKLQGDYDLICIFIDSLNLPNLDKPDYDRVVSKLDKLIPQLTELRGTLMADLGDEFDESFDGQVIDHILNNFKERTYKPYGSYNQADINRIAEDIRRKKQEALLDVDQYPDEDFPDLQEDLPVGVPVADEEVLYEFERVKGDLLDDYDDLNDMSNVAPPVQRRAIVTRLNLIQEALQNLEAIIDGRVAPTQEALNEYQQFAVNMGEFRNHLYRVGALA